MSAAFLATSPANAVCDAGQTTFNVTGANGAMTNYIIDGQQDPPISVRKGETYTFNVSFGSHPFFIKTLRISGSGSLYNSGVTNNGAESATLTWAVPLDAPSSLVYQCGVHDEMGGDITILDACPSEGEGEGEGQSGPCELAGACPDFDTEGTALYIAATTLVGTTYDWNATDADGTGIPENFEVALLKRVVCGSGSAFGGDATCVFNQNLAAVRAEGVLAAINGVAGTDTADVLAAMLSISGDLENTLRNLGLLNSYARVGGAKSISEPLSPTGDADGDGLTNLQEYTNVINAGGTIDDYPAAALNPLLDGTAASAASLPVAAIAGLGGLAALCAAGGAAALRRKAKGAAH